MKGTFSGRLGVSREARLGGTVEDGPVASGRRTHSDARGGRMKPKGILVGGVWFLMLTALPWAVGNGEDPLGAALEKVLRDNFRACQEERADAVLSTLHPESPARAETAEVLQHLFDTYDLSYDLLSFRFLGRDGDCAVAVGEQKTVKVRGPEFRNNVIRSVYVFRRHGASWTLWHQVILDVRPEAPGAQEGSKTP